MTRWFRRSRDVSRFAYALAPMAAAALWGGLYVASKWGFESVPPVSLAFSRIAVGAVTLLAVVRFRYPSRSFTRADVLGFVALGTVVAASIVTQFLGTALTTASQGSLVTVLTPVFTILLGATLLGERLGPGFVVGALVLGAGVYLSAVTGTRTSPPTDSESGHGDPNAEPIRS